MPVEIYRSPNFLVTEDAGVLRLEQLSRAYLGPCFLALGVALAGGSVAFLLEHWLGPSNPYFLLLRCFVVVMGAIGLLGLLALYLQRPQPFWVDPARGIASLKGRQMALSELASPELAEHQLAGTTFHGLMLTVRGKKLLLMSAASGEELQPVQEVLAQWLEVNPEAGGENPAVDMSERFLRAFLPAFYLGTGSLCAGVGYLFAPNLALGWGSSGVLLWPLGLWVVALGLLELIGFPATRKVLGLDIQLKDGELVLGKGVTLWGVAWLLSYFYFCSVSL